MGPEKAFISEIHISNGQKFELGMTEKTQAHGRPSNYKTHTNLVIFSQNASKAGITSRFLNALVKNRVGD